MNKQNYILNKALRRATLITLFAACTLFADANDAFNRWTNLTAEVSAQTANATCPEYALSGNTLHVLWVEYKYGETANLYYRRSTNKGGTWETPKKLFTFAAKNSLPIAAGYSRMMSVEGNNMHIAFADYDYADNGTGRLYYMRSTDGGGSFGQAVELANSGGIYVKIAHSVIKTAGNNIAVAYQNNTRTASQKGIHVAYSTDNGQSFRDTLAVPYTPLQSDLADFAYDGQKMIFLHHYLYYMYGFANGKVYATVSNDNGANFATHKLSRPFQQDGYEGEKSRFSVNSVTVNDWYYYTPKIAVANGHIHILFSEYKKSEGKTSTTWRPVYVRSADNGLSFEEPRELLDLDEGEHPVIAAKGGKVYVANYIVNKNILIKASSDNGATFSDATDHFKGRYPYGLSRPAQYKLLIDPRDASGATVHLTGSNHTLATSTNAGASFDYFMSFNSYLSGSASMLTEMLPDENGVKHFFTAYRRGSDSSKYFDILYHKTGAEAPPEAENRALKVKETQSNYDDQVALLVPATPSLDFKSAITAEMWVKFNPSETSSSPLILRNKESYYNDNTPNGFQIGYYVYNGVVELHSGIQTENGRFYHYSPDKITDNLWHHVAFTYDANGGLDNFILYVDGVAKKAQTVVGKIDAGDGIISLGSYYGSSYYKFDYQLDELRLWNKALSAEEIRQNMLRNNFENENNLKLYLNFNNTLKDLSGNGNDAVSMGIVKMESSNFNPPHPAFDVYKIVDEVSLNNKTKNATDYKWDFGNKISSTQPNPKYRYPVAGEYKITLTAQNENSVASAVEQVSIQGVERITPLKAGNKGEVAIDIYGGGLSPQNTSITLRRAGQTDIVGSTPVSVDGGHIQSKVALDGVALGDWTVIVKQGGTEYQLPQTFKVEEATESVPWVNIAGRNTVLLNRFQTYTINYGNSGNTDAYSVPLWLIVSNHDDLEVVFFDFDMVLPDYLKDHENAALIQETAGTSFVTDMVDGVAMNVRVYPLLIPVIRANSSGSLRIRIKSPIDYQLKASINGAWVENTGEEAQAAQQANGGMQRAPQVSPLSKAECITEILGKEVIDQTLSLVPGYDCLSNGFGMAKTAVQFATGSSKQSFWNATWNIGLGAVNCGASLVKDMAFPIKFGLFVINLSSKGYDMMQCLEPRGDDEKDVKTVSSFDPNEMIGPNGFGDENWMQPVSEMPYTILFENKSTATAPANEVLITDVLDKSKFDLSDFSFGAFGWGDLVFEQSVAKVREFSRDIDLRPAKNTIVRVSGKLDEPTATVKWNFLSLDPATMDEQEDPFLGFLPPNGDNHEGEGFVSFTVGLKPVTQTGAIIKNKATIIFDANQPILTNEYMNTFDLTPPQSSVTSAQTTEDDKILVSWTGSDVGSGVKKYTVWMQRDEEPIEPLILNTELTSYTFTPEGNGTYKFYCLATDNTNQEELNNKDFEIQHIFTNIELNRADNNKLYYYPNPVKYDLYVRLANNNHEDIIFLELIRADGTIVKKLNYTGYELNLGITLSVKDLTTGIYFLRTMDTNSQYTGKLVVE